MPQLAPLRAARPQAGYKARHGDNVSCVVYLVQGLEGTTGEEALAFSGHQMTTHSYHLAVSHNRLLPCCN